MDERCGGTGAAAEIEHRLRMKTRMARPSSQPAHPAESEIVLILAGNFQGLLQILVIGLGVAVEIRIIHLG